MNAEINQIHSDSFPAFEADFINVLASLGTIKEFEEGEELMSIGSTLNSPCSLWMA